MLPYYPMYAEKFNGSERVRLMSLEANGLYILCMNHAWDNDGLPPQIEQIITALGLSDQKARKARKSWPEVEPLFPVALDGRRRNEVQEDFRNKAIARSSDTAERVRKFRERHVLKRVTTDSGNAFVTHPVTRLRAYSSTSNSPDLKNSENLEFSLEVAQQSLETVIHETSARILKRHRERKCSLEKVKKLLAKIVAKVPEQEQLTTLEYIESQHEKWCGSWDWNKDNREFWKGLAPFLDPTEKLWENEPLRPWSPANEQPRQFQTAHERNEEIRRRKFAERIAEDVAEGRVREIQPE